MTDQNNSTIDEFCELVDKNDEFKRDDFFHLIFGAIIKQKQFSGQVNLLTQNVDSPENVHIEVIEPRNYNQGSKNPVIGYKIGENYFILRGRRKDHNIEKEQIERFAKDKKVYTIEHDGSNHFTVETYGTIGKKTINSSTEKKGNKFARNHNGNCVLESIFNALVDSETIKEFFTGKNEEINFDSLKREQFLNSKNYLEVKDFLENVVFKKELYDNECLDLDTIEHMMECIGNLETNTNQNYKKSELIKDLKILRAIHYNLPIFYRSKTTTNGLNDKFNIFLYEGNYYTISEDNKLYEATLKIDENNPYNLKINLQEDKNNIISGKLIENIGQQDWFMKCKTDLINNETIIGNPYYYTFCNFDDIDISYYNSNKNYFFTEKIINISLEEIFGKEADYNGEICQLDSLLNSINQDKLFDLLIKNKDKVKQAEYSSKEELLLPKIVENLKNNNDIAWLAYKACSMEDTDLQTFINSITNNINISDVKYILKLLKEKNEVEKAKKFLEEIIKNGKLDTKLSNDGTILCDNSIEVDSCSNKENIVVTCDGNGIKNLYGIEEDIFSKDENDNVTTNNDDSTKKITVFKKFKDDGKDNQVVILKIKENDNIYHSICYKNPKHDDDDNKFFEELGDTFNQYVKALKYKEKKEPKILKHKLITFSGITGSGNDIDKLNNAKYSEGDFNTIDLFNAILFMLEEDDLIKEGVSFLLTDGISKAYSYLNKLKMEAKKIKNSDKKIVEIDVSIFDGLDCETKESLMETYSNIITKKELDAIHELSFVYKNKEKEEENEKLTEEIDKIVCIGDNKKQSETEKEFIKKWLNKNGNKQETTTFKELSKIEKTGEYNSLATKVIDYFCDNNKENLKQCCESYIKSVKNENTGKDNLTNSDVYIIFECTKKVLEEQRDDIKKDEDEIKKEIAESILKNKNYMKKHNSLMCSYELKSGNKFEITITTEGLAKDYKVTGELKNGKTIEQILLDIPVFGLNNVIKKNGFTLKDKYNEDVNIDTIKKGDDNRLYEALEFKDIIKVRGCANIGQNSAQTQTF